MQHVGGILVGLGLGFVLCWLAALAMRRVGIFGWLIPFGLATQQQRRQDRDKRAQRTMDRVERCLRIIAVPGLALVVVGVVLIVA